MFAPELRESLVTAVDVAQTTVKAAAARQRQRGLTQHYVCGDITALPVAAQTIDIIISTSTLDHFTTREAFAAALRELRRVLKPRGSLIITINNRWDLNYYLMVRVGQLLGMVPYPVQFYTRGQLTARLNECGLQVVAGDHCVHIISPLNTVLLGLRKILPSHIMNHVAERCIAFSRWLGGKTGTKWLTGWFIAVHCVLSSQEQERRQGPTGG